MQVEIMMALEEKFDIQLDEDNAEQIVTVQHAADLIHGVVTAKKAWIMTFIIPEESLCCWCDWLYGLGADAAHSREGGNIWCVFCFSQRCRNADMF